MAKELPISFTTEMNKAILAKHKTVFRWVIKIENPGFYRYATLLSDGTYKFDGYGTADFKFHKPRYQVGDKLWVKESYCHGIEWDDCKSSKVDPLCGGNDIWYLADGPRPTEGWGKTRLGMFMPKWAARTWLEVVSVRPERLQDITEEDCWKEGIDKHEAEKLPYINKLGVGCATATYSNQWDSINAKRGYPWEGNWWVFRYEFKEAKRQ